jgi:hypothetical protein
MTNLHLQFAETQQWRARTRGNEFQKEAALLWGKFSQNLHQFDYSGAGCSATLVFCVRSKVFNIPVARILARDYGLRSQKMRLHRSSQEDTNKKHLHFLGVKHAQHLFGNNLRAIA